MDLDDVADELYGLLPTEFTATRDRRSTEARQAGDRELAATIKRLKRPSVGAWLANLLVRRRGQEVERLLELGASLRDAQERLAGEQMRALSQQRQLVVLALVQEARGLARESGQAVSEATARELQETLEAALADPAAADALRAGRLTASLSYSGLGMAGGEAGRDTKETEAVAAALRDAEAAVSTARHRDEDRARELQRAEAELETVRGRIDDLSRQLDDLRSEETRLAGKVGELQQAAETAQGELHAAESRLAELRSDDPLGR